MSAGSAVSERSTPSAAEAELSALMRAAQGGDADAYRRLLRRCVPLIAGWARAQGVRGPSVDDVVQETLITVHRARATYDPARPFMPWLRAIASRRAVDAIRQGTRRPQEVHDPLAYEAHADGETPADRLIEVRQRDAHLASVVATLPPGQRQAVEQIAIRELSLEEAATVTGRSKGALKVNLHRALKALRVALGDGKEKGDA